VTSAQAQNAESCPVVRRVSVGSAEGNGLVIADPTVSRVHAELIPSDRGLWVRDLGSRNGTYLDAIRIKEAEWQPGVTLRLGGARCVLGPAPVKVPFEIWRGNSFGPLVGASAVMRELFATLARVAVTSSSVLITGETGTGKELVARALHEASPRASAPYGIVDCAALPESLAESELFGHVRGAFTGAVSARTGAFEAAAGGTILLDEVGELPLAVQAKLLRFLESHTVRRVGETSYRAVDVRVLAATHRDLLTMVSTGEFREDLYFRLAVVPIVVPPLRERPEDIALLAARFASLQAAEPLPATVLAEIAKRPLHGNARELRNFVERAIALGPDRALALQTDAETSRPVESSREGAEGGSESVNFTVPFKSFREAWIEHGEQRYLTRLIAAHAGDMTAALRAAEIDRTYLFRLKRKYKL